MWDPNCMLCAIFGECTFIFKSLTKIGFYHSSVLRWWLFGSFGGIQQTLDYSLAHSASRALPWLPRCVIWLNISKEGVAYRYQATMNC